MGLSIDATQAKDAGGHEPHGHPGGHLTIEPDGRKLNKPWAAREKQTWKPLLWRGTSFQKGFPESQVHVLEHKSWRSGQQVFRSTCCTLKPPVPSRAALLERFGLVLHGT